VIEIDKIKSKIEDFLSLDTHEKVAFLAPYLIAMFLCSRVVEFWRLCEGDLVYMVNNVEYLYKSFPRFVMTDLLIGSITGYLIVWYSKWNAKIHYKNTKKGMEYGSARWGNAKDIKPFIDENFSNNIILSATEFLTLNPRMKQFKLNRNKHVLVEGGSGAGKTYSIVKGNLLQANTSFVVTDPKGTLILETGSLFAKMRYRIKALDTVDFSKMHYNPFAYIKKPRDILIVANVLYKNLKPLEGGTAQDPMWDAAALLWMQAVIGYIWYEAPKEEQNINTMMEFYDAEEVRENDENFKNAVDLLFEELEKKNLFHFAVRQRKKYKKAAGKTAKSILITMGAYFSALDVPEVRDMLAYDELELDTYGDPDQKTILYVTMSDTDDRFNFIIGLVFTQLFNVLCYKADKEFGGKLKTPVQFILDEFAQYTIPNFQLLIASIRSRLMSCIIFLQTRSQLKERYKDAADIIVGNCDSSIFLGGNDKTTLKELEEMLGKETIDLWNDGRSYGGQSDTSSVNYNKTGRELMTVQELSQMERDKCIVRVAGLPPFFSDKYDIHNHPNFKYLSDYDERNTFNFQEYRKALKKKERSKNMITYHSGDQYKVIV